MTADKTMTTLTNTSLYIIGSDSKVLKTLEKCDNILILVWSVMKLTNLDKGDRCPDRCLVIRTICRLGYTFLNLGYCISSPLWLHSNSVISSCTIKLQVENVELLFFIHFFIYSFSSPHGGEERWKQKMKLKLEIGWGIYVSLDQSYSIKMVGCQPFSFSAFLWTSISSRSMTT